MIPSHSSFDVHVRKCIYKYIKGCMGHAHNELNYHAAHTHTHSTSQRRARDKKAHHLVNKTEHTIQMQVAICMVRCREVDKARQRTNAACLRWHTGTRKKSYRFSFVFILLRSSYFSPCFAWNAQVNISQTDISKYATHVCLFVYKTLHLVWHTIQMHHNHQQQIHIYVCISHQRTYI